MRKKAPRWMTEYNVKKFRTLRQAARIQKDFRPEVFDMATEEENGTE